MIEDQRVALNGKTYIWSYASHVRLPEHSWQWTTSCNMEVPLALVGQLNARFLEDHAAGVVEMLDDSEIMRFRQVLDSMGATDEQIKSFGLDGTVHAMGTGSDASLPEIEMPPAAFSPFNNSVLREWFFATPPRFDFNQLFVGYVGYGPFAPDDSLSILLLRHRVFLSPLVSTIFLPHISVVMLGREGWTEEEVDALIDQRIGDGR